ncbi:MAG TPA: pyridoxamine 5'-phosphate oxidase family protein [Candidatus Paceibacterota bacterium]|nr:pyridoxamine 5'-phosphate oxidase family protein [Candidatus Paceibacterota bacterium]
MEEVVRRLAQDIFDKGYFFSLATFDDGGLWVSDVFYVADNDWNIYWLSALDTRHSKAIEQNAEAAGTIRITTTPQEASEALQIAGHVEKVPKDMSEMVERLFRQKRGKEKKAEADRYNGNQSWYKLTPHKIRLSHQETFGLEKQDVEIKR